MRPCCTGWARQSRAGCRQGCPHSQTWASQAGQRPAPSRAGAGLSASRTSSSQSLPDDELAQVWFQIIARPWSAASRISASLFVLLLMPEREQCSRSHAGLISETHLLLCVQHSRCHRIAFLHCALWPSSTAVLHRIFMSIAPASVPAVLLGSFLARCGARYLDRTRQWNTYVPASLAV